MRKIKTTTHKHILPFDLVISGENYQYAKILNINNMTQKKTWVKNVIHSLCTMTIQGLWPILQVHILLKNVIVGNIQQSSKTSTLRYFM